MRAALPYSERGQGTAMTSHYHRYIYTEQVADRLGRLMDLFSKPVPFCTGITRFING
jgi:hypothetical protein